MIFPPLLVALIYTLHYIYLCVWTGPIWDVLSHQLLQILLTVNFSTVQVRVLISLFLDQSCFSISSTPFCRVEQMTAVCTCTRVLYCRVRSVCRNSEEICTARYRITIPHQWNGVNLMSPLFRFKHLRLSLCLSLSLSVCLSVCLSLSLSQHFCFRPHVQSVLWAWKSWCCQQPKVVSLKVQGRWLIFRENITHGLFFTWKP